VKERGGGLGMGKGGEDGWKLGEGEVLEDRRGEEEHNFKGEGRGVEELFPNGVEGGKLKEVRKNGCIIQEKCKFHFLCVVIKVKSKER